MFLQEVNEKTVLVPGGYHSCQQGTAIFLLSADRSWNMCQNMRNWRKEYFLNGQTMMVQPVWVIHMAGVTRKSSFMTTRHWRSFILLKDPINSLLFCLFLFQRYKSATGFRHLSNKLSLGRFTQILHFRHLVAFINKYVPKHWKPYCWYSFLFDGKQKVSITFYSNTIKAISLILIDSNSFHWPQDPMSKCHSF